MKSITDPRLKETKMECDSVGRLKTDTAFENKYLEASYNDDKKEVTVTDYNKTQLYINTTIT